MEAETPRRGRRKGVIAAAAVFAALILAVGYLSVSQSSYKGVEELAGVTRRSKVTVEGSLYPLPPGYYRLLVDGREYYVESRGSYGVSTTSDGGLYAVFILSGGNHLIVALYYMGDASTAYQLGSSLSSSVVVSGVYDPEKKAVLEGPGWSVELPYLQVDAILKGCHSSYERGTAVRG